MNEVDAGREEERRRGGEEEGIQSNSDDGGGEVEEEEFFSLNASNTGTEHSHVVVVDNSTRTHLYQEAYFLVVVVDNSTRTYARTLPVLFALIFPFVPVLKFTHTFAQTALFGQCYHVHPHEKNSFSDFNNHNCHTNRKPQKQKGTKTVCLAIIAVFTVDNKMIVGGGPQKQEGGESKSLGEKFY
jgi:hypothetical protein